ncbi:MULTISPECIES: putative manganese transporter [unclassified Pseudoalteromonas]|uniref:putative manganese transporter n=1 Tax=unclassified Pseudoalteromonas TaxID=194690 RepID=UPI002359DF06|nr:MULTISPECIES: putative manganese transporter [unclassified Pseudoalteromonas]MDC9563075.1 putative manganese transporter [Pseudoalteromonas sp. GAB2316C]MDC9567565.1 putative manganese transporter [Pseudoalteromonas sp. GABNB9D]MDC9571737.1 putative manganese transporter [Pseudoalteromonas sp. GABNS16A]MDC9576245.1 putative manganese transporter [Pseudoalteromonas sp. GABNS16E]MDC9583522.1 putative manganese transporter [Pseudoalteromonas sp. GABNS16C]
MILLSQIGFITPASKRFVSQNKRLLLPLFLLVCLAVPSLREITITALSDAFFQVSVFVAATLLIYYYAIEHIPQLEMSYLSAKSKSLEVLFASVLGALPGCGGAIVVVTQYTKGQASFGAIVAVLTATMGDAAFLLLATRPTEGLTIMAIGLVVGTLCGLIVNAIHKPDFLRPSAQEQKHQVKVLPTKIIKISKPVWMFAIIPSLIIAFLIAFNVDFNQFGQYTSTGISLFGAAMALFTVVIWAYSSKGESYKEVTSEDDECNPPSKLIKVLQDTHFVTAWVVASFMLFEILVSVVGLDLKTWFMHYAYLAPLIAVVIGFLPGCGPQIIVTTLYIQGIIPFSALAANAISNDGDALFPAIAMAPKAAVIATLYTSIPALVVGYGLYFLS